jgi:hypothetical protein
MEVTFCDVAGDGDRDLGFKAVAALKRVGFLVRLHNGQLQPKGSRKGAIYRVIRSEEGSVDDGREDEEEGGILFTWSGKRRARSMTTAPQTAAEDAQVEMETQTRATVDVNMETQTDGTAKIEMKTQTDGTAKIEMETQMRATVNAEMETQTRVPDTTDVSVTAGSPPSEKDLKWWLYFHMRRCEEEISRNRR